MLSLSFGRNIMSDAEPRSKILTVDVPFEGETHTASYFIENEMIHAVIGGRALLAPLGSCPASGTVRALLEGHLLQRHRRQRQSESWTDV
jgi:hypothetical protein